MPPERIVANTGELADALAARLEREAAAAIAARGRFSIALSGGSVATKLFPRLALAGLDWTRCDFFWCDERAVPPDHPDSNYAAAVRLWLEPAAVPRERIHRMRAESPDLESAAARYAHELSASSRAQSAGLRGQSAGIGAQSAEGRGQRGTAGGQSAEGRGQRMDALDVVLLGVGPDGHVASLFPGHPALYETRRSVVPIFDSPKPPPRRLTLTLPMLCASRLVVIATMGSEKAPVIRQLDDPASSLPVAIVARTAERVLLLLDPEAAEE